MAVRAKPVPEGLHTATPYMIVKGVKDALGFYEQAFGAVEMTEPTTGPEGDVQHAHLKLGDSAFMLTAEYPDFPNHLGPLALGGSPVHIYLYVDDVDAWFRRAI